MSQPLQNCNLVGAQVYPVADLGCTGLLGVLSTSVSGGVYTTTPFSTGEPATVLVFGQTASGTCNVKLAVAPTAATISYAAGTTNGSFTIGTTPGCVTINTTSASSYFGIQFTDNGQTSTFVNQGTVGYLAIFVCYVLTAGENWSNIANGHKAVASRINGPAGSLPNSDGSGVTLLNVG